MKYNFESVSKRFHTGSKKWEELLANGVKDSEDLIPFSVADMEFETAPEIKEALCNKINGFVLGYSNPTDNYKKAVCDWMKKRHGWEVKPEWMVPQHGIVDGFFEAVKTYTKEGDGVLLMTPVYYPMYHAVKDNNRVIVDNPLIRKGNTYEIDFEDFEKKCKDENTKMLILCSPHNPCGRVWTKEELTKIGRICIDNNVLIISDEIHFDLEMPGHKHICFASLSEEFAQHCLVMTAPTKTFNLAGLQTSNIFIPNEELRNKYWTSLRRTNPNFKCNILGLTACEAAYNNCEEWLNQCLEVINTNKNIIIDFFKKNFPQIVVMDLQATYLLWMDWSGLGLSYQELERINHEEARLFFDEGYVFGKQGECFERWNLACPTRYIEEALERMKVAYSKYVK